MSEEEDWIVRDTKKYDIAINDCGFAIDQLTVVEALGVLEAVKNEILKTLQE